MWWILLGFFGACGATALVLSTLAFRSAARAAALRPDLLEARLHSIESAVRSLRGVQTDLAGTLEQVANRVKMQRVRNAATHGENSPGEPDPYKNPDEWRTAMNKRLAATKLGGK
jgi:hypothetical protein